MPAIYLLGWERWSLYAQIPMARMRACFCKCAN
jgi:hypothetical protein